MSIFSRENTQTVGLLLAPSWLSGLVAVAGGLFVTVGVLLVFAFNNTAVQQQVIDWEQSRPQPALTTASQILPQSDRPTLTGSWPLLIVWGFVGLLVYFVTMAVIHAISETKLLKDSLEYVNARPNLIIETALEHMTLRIVSAVTLLVLIVVFIKKALPYSITAAHAASDVHSLTSVLYGLLSFAAVAFMLQLLAVFLRLSVGRVRIFSR